MADSAISIGLLLCAALVLLLERRLSGAQRMPWDQFLFSLDGRITRASWWLRFVVPVFLIISDVVVAAGPNPEMSSMVFNAGGIGFLTGILLWLAVVVSVKRYHDHGRSGWFLLIALLPQLGTIWVLIELGFLRGTRGPNRFGPDPRRPASVSGADPSLTAPGAPMFREVLAEDGRENR